MSIFSQLSNYNVITMKKITKLIAIGNSRGIRIPQQMLEEVDLSGSISLQVKDDSIVVMPVADSKQRTTWEAAFSQVSKKDKENLELDEIIDHTWDDQEWEW
jgi:antitoxin MazE